MAEATKQGHPMPTAPTAMQRWFPIGAWLKGYSWRRSATADLIAAVSVAALLIPESMGYASVAGVPAETSATSTPCRAARPNFSPSSCVKG